jgi:hypothetical protein
MITAMTLAKRHTENKNKNISDCQRFGGRKERINGTQEIFKGLKYYVWNSYRYAMLCIC